MNSFHSIHKYYTWIGFEGVLAKKKAPKDKIFWHLNCSIFPETFTL